MDEELQALIKDQEQLRAMKKSCDEFEKALNERFAKYLQEKMGVTGPVSMIELIGKAKGQ